MKMFTDIGLDVAITELDPRVPVTNDGDCKLDVAKRPVSITETV